MTETEINKVLKERALRLQAEEDRPHQKGTVIQGLQFRLFNETYAIDTSFIIEVIITEEITPLPCTPKFVLGIINFRGKILSIIDIGTFFSLPIHSVSTHNTIIVLKHQNMEFGLICEQVLDPMEIELHSLQKEVSTITQIPNNYLLGITNKQTIVLNIKQLLEDNNIIVNETVTH